MTASFARASAAARTRLDDVVVVDLDVHVLDRPEHIAKYCDPKWRDVLLSGQAATIPPYGGGANVFPTFPGQWAPRAAVATTPAEMRADLDELSIDIPILFPEGLLSLPRQPNPEYALALAQAFNRWLAEEYLTVRGFYAGVVAAPQDPEGTVREIERYAGHERMVGVIMPTAGISHLWGERRYDPIYEAAETHGLAVIYHAGGILRMPTVPIDIRQFDNWFLAHTYSHSIAMLSTVTSLFSTAMPARFPKLQIILTEAGLSLFAHAMMRLDWAWEQRSGDVPLLEEKPSAYMRRQMYYATQPIEEPENLQDMADVIRAIGGEDSVVFASDYPHHDFDHPKKVFDIPVSAEVKRKIMGTNALRALNIPFPSASERVPSKAHL